MEELIIMLLGCALIPFIGYLSMVISQADREKPDDNEQEEWIKKCRKRK